MDRRSFINWVGLGAIASSLPVAIAACTAQDTKPPATQAAGSGKGEFTSVGSVADLDKQGFLLNKEVAGGPVLVVRDGSDASKLIAVNPVCPHEKCVVEWGSDRKSFDCPCHGAKFALDGKPTQGPTNQPLPIYSAKIEGTAVMVKV